MEALYPILRVVSPSPGTFQPGYVSTCEAEEVELSTNCTQGGESRVFFRSPVASHDAGSSTTCTSIAKGDSTREVEVMLLCNVVSHTNLSFPMVGGTLWDTLRNQMKKGHSDKDVANLKDAIVDEFSRFFDRKRWRSLLEKTSLRLGLNKESVATPFRGVEAQLDVMHSMIVKQTAHFSRRPWCALYQEFLYAPSGDRRMTSFGVPFPKILRIWEEVMGITKAFEGALDLQGNLDCKYRLPSVLLSDLLASAPLRKQVGVADGANQVYLDALGGVDALPICPYGSVLNKV